MILNEASELLPRPARYLLRFDDLCPTVCLERWRSCMALIEEFQLRPILALVPSNQDPDLETSPPDPGFWARIRAMEQDGATIGLHGYRHLCASRGRGLLPLHRASEFAGVPLDTQREWIREGLRILRGRGLNPRIWVAPRHGFDAHTLQALHSEGIRALSDGLARVPFVRGGLVWVPQQLFGPAEKAGGLWTICIHPNSCGDARIAELRAFLRRRAGQFTSVDGVLAESGLGALSLKERAHEIWALSRVRAARSRKRLGGRWRMRSWS
ncbi:MAG: DUF2334 domain-containing protein [Terracidiphilus sp.]